MSLPENTVFAIFARHLAMAGLALAALFAAPILQIKAQPAFTVPEALSLLQQRHAVLFAYDHEKLSPISVPMDLPVGDLDASLAYLSQYAQLAFSQPQPGRFLVSFALGSKPHPAARAAGIPVSGRVVDSETGLPVPYANLRCFSQKTGAVCDNKGIFQLKLLTTDTVTLVASSLGYQPEKWLLRPGSGEGLVLRLSPAPARLEDILIVGGAERALEIADGGQTLAINPRRLEMLSGLGDADALRSLQRMPGIGSGGKDGASLHIRGGNPDQNLILWDGIPIYRPDHLFGQFGALNPAAVSQVQVYRSGFGARYGGRSSAVIDATGKTADRNVAHIGFGANLLQAQASLETPVFEKKGSFLLAGRRAYSDAYQSPFFRQFFGSAIAGTTIGNEIDRIATENLPYTTQPSFAFGDLNARLVLFPGKKDLIRASFFSSRDRLKYALASVPGGGTAERTEIDDELELRVSGANLTWRHSHPAGWWVSASTGYSQHHSDYQGAWKLYSSGGIYAFTSAQSAGLRDANALVEAGWNRNRLAWRAGVEANRLEVDRFAKTASVVRENEAEMALTAAPFAEGRWEKQDRFSLTLGLRAPWYGPVQAWMAEPRFAGWYRFAPDWKAKASAGRYHQFVNQKRIFNLLQLGEEFWTLSRDRAGVVAANHLTAGVGYEKNAWTIDLEAYLKNFNGIMTYLPSSSLDNFPFPMDMRAYAGGRSLARGMDLTLQRKEGIWTGWVSYSFAQVSLVFDSLNMGLPFPSEFDIRHDLKITQLVQWKRWDFSALWFLGSGAMFTAPSGFVSYRTVDSLDAYFLEFGAPNASRLPLRHRLDLTASFRLHPEKASWSGLAGIALYNAYNQANTQGIRFSVIPNTSKRDEAQIVASRQYAPGISPNLFFQFRF